MQRINPASLKAKREELGLSLDELAERSTINKATIHRIERGKTKRTNAHTVRQLAQGLGVEPRELMGVKTDGSGDDDAFYYRSQLNLRVSHEARNALTLVGWRYGVKPTDIIELAPLLFHIAAEESLAERLENLGALRAARDQIRAMDDKFPHISERMVEDWDGVEFDDLEMRSIRARDLHGSMLDEYDSYRGIDSRPPSYEEGEQNPFIQHLRRRFSTIGAAEDQPAQLEWQDGCSPRYALGKPEALRYFGGDEEVADDVVNGMVSIHEIPKDLRGEGQESSRAAWARERIKELSAKNVELLELLDVRTLLP